MPQQAMMPAAVKTTKRQAKERHQVVALGALDEQALARRNASAQLSCNDLCVAFLKAGMAFGGGPGIMAALEEELVRKRQAVSREDFQAMYALGRLVPSGTMTAVAVAYGHRFRGWVGSVVAVTALVLPSTLLTVLLTMAYGVLNGPALGLVSAVLLPAALALIVVAALKFGKDLFRPSRDPVIAAGAFLAACQFDVHPSLVLLGGGLVGLIAWRRGTER